MNENHPMFPDLTPEEREVTGRILGAVETFQPNNQFVSKFETELRREFVAQKENRMKRIHLFWQSLAGATAVIALTLLIVWLVRSVAPEIVVTPVPAINGTPQPTALPVDATPLPTATPALPAYDRSGTTVYRAVDFPTAPTETDLYPYSPLEQLVTVESAKALAQQLGIDGQVYEGGYYSYRYLVSDGQQRLFVNSDQDFLYFSSTRNTTILPDISLDVAQTAIDAYLAAHGFDFAHKIQAGSGPGWFMIVPLAADGLPILYGSGQLPGWSVAVSPDGQILQVQANLLITGGNSLGKFPIISAEEAWQTFLNPNAWLGSMESSGSGTISDVQAWYRAYPENQSLMLYCGATIYPAIDPIQPPLITCDDYLLSGNLAGLDSLDASNFSTFVAVNGQFKTNSAGVPAFEVESWEMTSLQKQYLTSGEVRREGDQVILTAAGNDYVLAEVPADFPVPAKDISVAGVVVDNVFEWDVLGIHMPFGGGGGGGGAFARINLSGNPVSWPTPEPFVSPTPGTVLGQRLEGVRGELNIFIYQKEDSSQEKEYQLSIKTDDYYSAYILQGTDLFQLDDNHNRPVDIWGAVTGYTPTGNPIVTVERSVIPYPDLEFQVFRGKEKVVTLDGQDVILLTTEDGQTYVEFSGDAPAPSFSLIGVAGDLVDVYVLLMPDETFGDYPAARVFGGGLAGDTPSKPLDEIPYGPHKPYIIPGDSPSTSGLPTLTIESIDLGYYIADPRNVPATGAYLQPVWRFYGHYDNGNVFECLVQALRPEYLYPEEEQTGN